MGYRSMTDVLGGCTGETPGRPFSYGQGYGPAGQPYSNYDLQFAPLIDRMIGRAFYTVKCVADHIELIRYVAFNMEAIVTCAQQMVANNPLILASAEAQVNATNLAVQNAASVAAAAQVAATQGSFNAFILNWINSLPVYSGTGPAPVAAGQWFLNNGKPEQAQ